MKSALVLGVALAAGVTACGDDTSGGGGGGGRGGGGGAGGAPATTSTSTSTASTSTGAGGDRPYGSCDKTGDSASTGAGPGDLSCFAIFSCTGGELRIESDGHADGTATSTCLDGAGDVLGTCEEAAGIECEYEASCCHDVVN